MWLRGTMAPTRRFLYGDEIILALFWKKALTVFATVSNQAPAEVWKMTGDKTKGRPLKFVEFSFAIQNFTILDLIGRKAQLAS